MESIGDGASSSSDLDVLVSRMRRDFAVLAASVSASQPYSSQDHFPSSQEHLPSSSEFSSSRRRCWQRPGKKLPSWLINNVLLFSFVYQCLVVLLYRLVFNQAFSSTVSFFTFCDENEENEFSDVCVEKGVEFDVGVGVMIGMQVLQVKVFDCFSFFENKFFFLKVSVSPHDCSEVDKTGQFQIVAILFIIIIIY
jgi:hypothetical protein